MADSIDMIEALSFEFMRNALIAGVIAGIVCGVIGTLVVVNRIMFISGGISHAAYGGIGLAVYFQIPFIIGVMGFSVITAVIIAAVTLKDRERSDTVIGVLWAVGMAVGVLFIDRSPGYQVDLMSYLFGSILTVPRSDLSAMAIMTSVILFIVGWFYNDYLAMSYDREFARVRGIPVRFLYFLLLIMIAVTVVLVIRIVGLILVIALLSIPPYIAEKFTTSLAGMMVLSVILNCVFTLTGLFLSYAYDLTSGASIIITAGTGFFLSMGYEKFRKREGKIQQGQEHVRKLQL